MIQPISIWLITDICLKQELYLIYFTRSDSFIFYSFTCFENILTFTTGWIFTMMSDSSFTIFVNTIVLILWHLINFSVKFSILHCSVWNIKYLVVNSTQFPILYLFPGLFYLFNKFLYYHILLSQFEFYS